MEVLRRAMLQYPFQGYDLRGTMQQLLNTACSKDGTDSGDTNEDSTRSSERRRMNRGPVEQKSSRPSEKSSIQESTLRHI